MSIVSLTFFVFIFALLIVYYAVPKKAQWIILLIASIVFYLFGGIWNILFLLGTSLSIYLAANWIQNSFCGQRAFIAENKENLTKDERKQYKTKQQKKRKWVMISALLLNFGILCVVKYFHFALEQVNGIILLFHGRPIEDIFELIVPLGISFYTFQSTGYLLDVYWEKCEAEKNYFKTLLFISFFPQITQGPISKFDQLSKELFSEHALEYDNYSRGFQRMLWGFVKKMLLANILAPCVQDVFANYVQYSSVTVFIGAVMYSIQIYADFSGYMDIMCGYCEMLGIHLTENFNRPYFSKSVAEYWRRWHISLGEWFKNYVYYPIGISKWNRKLAVATSEKLGKKFGYTIPATIALVIVWLATGLWHGASWAYVVWGLANGFFIILSMWMEPIYEKCKKLLHIKENTWLWRAFQVVRTFLLVTLIKVLPEVGTLSAGFGLIGAIFTNLWLPANVAELFPFIDFSMSENLIKMAIALLVAIVFFIVSFLQRKHSLSAIFHKIPWGIRFILILIIIVLIIAFGVSATWGQGGFMYENY